VNEISFVFDEAVALSLLRLSNYTKDPARGVDDFELLADGLLVYRGRLRRASGGAEAEWQSVVLIDEPAVCQAEVEAGRVFFSGAPEHAETAVLLINESIVVSKDIGFTMPMPPPAAAATSRPKTAVRCG
jgi:hypothetical protein